MFSLGHLTQQKKAHLCCQVEKLGDKVLKCPSSYPKHFCNWLTQADMTLHGATVQLVARCYFENPVFHPPHEHSVLANVNKEALFSSSTGVGLSTTFRIVTLSK